MSWTNLISAVNAVITSNGANEITGQVLRELLTVNVIPILGSSKYKGLAIPSTSPGTPQYDVFYIASQAGTYANFGGAVIPKAGIYTLRYVTNAWVLDTILAIEDSAIVGDRYATISTNSKAIKSSGSISYTVKPFLSYVAEQDIIIAANAGAYMRARVTSYNSTTGALVADVKEAVGAGTYTAWEINLGSLVPYWGDILGTLSDQTDLQTALNLKANTSDLTALSNTVNDLSDAVTLLQAFRDTFILTGASNGDTLIYNGTNFLPNPGLGGNNVLYISQLIRAVFATASYTELSPSFAYRTALAAFSGLTGFQTFLWPETKLAKIGFFQKPDTNFPSYRALEADFSRPNIGATSGATVFRNGLLITLLENQPDWDDSSGSPVIKMRPQAENLISFTETFSGGNWVNSGSPSLTQNQISPRGSLDAWSYDSSNGTVRANSSVTLSATASENFYMHGLYVKKIVGGATQARLQNNRSNGGAVYADFDLDNGTIITVSNGTARMEENYNGNGWYRISLISEVLATGTFSLILATQDAINKNYAIAGGSFISGQNDYSYVPRLTSAAATRAANTFEFTDLITKGSIAANGDFTLLINPYIYENADFNTAVVRFLSGSTRLFDFGMYPDGRLRVLDRINGGWITPTQNSGEGLKPIILVFNGATKILKVYFQGALQGTSPDLTLSVNKVEFNAPDDIAYDLHDLDFSPILLNDTEAIAVLNSL
jgi:hypothetical protein